MFYFPVVLLLLDSETYSDQIFCIIPSLALLPNRPNGERAILAILGENVQRDLNYSITSFAHETV